MTGHGGFFNVLRRTNNSVMSVFSLDPDYRVGNLFGNGVLVDIGEQVLNLNCLPHPRCSCAQIVKKRGGKRV